MAWVTGTANDYRDLLGKLRDFLVSNATLTAAGQNWTLLSGLAAGTPSAGAEMVFKGPGLANDADIRIGLKLFENAGLGRYNLGVVGLTTSGLTDIENQPGASKAHWMLLLNSTMTYWFIANGRRFQVIVRAAGNYPQMYAGFILPEHLPDDWPYPLFVGACSYTRDLDNSHNGLANTAYWNGYGTNYTQTDSAASGELCGPDRIFRVVSNYYSNSQDSYNLTTHTGPWFGQWESRFQRQSLTNQPILKQGYLMSNNETAGYNFYGRFDGLFYVPAFGTTPEQNIAVGGVTYLAIPNVFRTSDGNYCAYALQ